MREVREVSAIQADKQASCLIFEVSAIQTDKLLSCPDLYEGSISSFAGKLTELHADMPDKLALLK